ncbi:unnamed protein product, partial [Mycena citricolor]
MSQPLMHLNFVNGVVLLGGVELRRVEGGDSSAPPVPPLTDHAGHTSCASIGHQEDGFRLRPIVQRDPVMVPQRKGTVSPVRPCKTPMGTRTRAKSSARYPTEPRNPRRRSRFVGVFQFSTVSTFSLSILIPSSVITRPSTFSSCLKNWSLFSPRYSLSCFNTSITSFTCFLWSSSVLEYIIMSSKYTSMKR